MKFYIIEYEIHNYKYDRYCMNIYIQYQETNVHWKYLWKYIT